MYMHAMHMHMRMQVTKAFRQQSLLVHPDKNSAPEAEEAFKRVHAAYIALKEEVAQGRAAGAAAEAQEAASTAAEGAVEEVSGA